MAGNERVLGRGRGGGGAGGGGCRLPLVVVVTVVVTAVTGEVRHGKALPSPAATTPSRYLHLPALTIINGTDSILRQSQNGFIYCFAAVPASWGRFGALLRVLWTDPYGRPLPSYRGRTQGRPQVFTVREGVPLPHSYLVFRGFSADLEGQYSCSLLVGSRLLTRQSIRLRFFRPSFRVVLLPRCVRAGRGGTLLLPSPVVGQPLKPAAWKMVEGEMDPASVLRVGDGLLLQNLRGPMVWRGSVSLGAGLSHHQDVYVAVEDEDEGEGGSELGADHPCTPASSLRHFAGSSSSVAMANEVIEDIQIHSYLRRVAEEG